MHPSFSYRPDIDGLRAFAVFLVIGFHSGFSLLEGGFVGVDVFFVISGYLITALIYGEMTDKRFSFLVFYRRRASRLLPSLFVLLAAVLIFGFVFYDEKTFDNLGKEIFFSAFGLANILFAQGEQYFASEEAYRPLIHLWSLGVEEQFYAFWPLLLIFFIRTGRAVVLLVTALLLLVSLGMSEWSVREGESLASYYLPHYRAFELLIGALLAIVMSDERYAWRATRYSPPFLPWLGAGMILLSALWLESNSRFPGLNALWPCLGTALIIFHGNRGSLCRLLASRELVWIGLISYPLYLFHQPVIAGLEFFQGEQAPWMVFSIVVLIAVPAAWMSYCFLEIPARRYARRAGGYGKGMALGTLSVGLLAGAGFLVAKTNGLEARFRILNPFAFEVAKAHASSFHKDYVRGFNVAETQAETSVLFIGDSVLQQYVAPIAKSLGLSPENVDVVSRGACVLLKGVAFNDQSADISCNELREQLYDIDKTYDHVIISQLWDTYDERITNFPEGSTIDTRWAGFIQATVDHFRPMSRQVTIIGPHVHVEGVQRLQPSIAIDFDDYREGLNQLKVEDLEELAKSDTYFQHLSQHHALRYLSPYRIFCDKRCQVSDDGWSFFSDRQHLTGFSEAFVVKRLRQLYPP
ncbi:acyltransferase family protein [Halomonas korlensis]|uniref:Peptidoglycan/LPS O-acetylase OafA/YrhL, contains acyltransferase and SGNH-hydrolase domains n=1 Tax=Halomonas korlensis TaxID=463301 RepID=A0A1I7FC41_9GAMM|nr:acyltransferase family protein [Halomonas korlensis]SFU33685.1 Peptidoglycan/LPS O-acetylase OafA/YrhL, contains acyltransferase and SGNH-hydrolase domains [Halomonas korlensis]